MRGSMNTGRLLAAGAILLLFAPGSPAQLGLYQLPQTNFRWHWGNIGPEEQRRSTDIEVSGSESFFRCDLSARIRPSSVMSPMDVRQVESDLRTRIDFIYAATQAMSYLEQTRDLDWAVLDCKRNESAPVSAEESASRQAEAREKMLRELERRRAKQQRAND